MTGVRDQYPRAEGQDLDALAANMGITRVIGESDADVRRRVVDHIREPVRWRPMGRRQRIAAWLAAHRMPTFAEWFYPGHSFRVGEPQFIGEIPPRWVTERNVDGGFSWP